MAEYGIACNPLLFAHAMFPRTVAAPDVPSQDIDFRVETNNVSDALVIDGGLDKASFNVPLTLSNLPTADPGAAGALWNNSGVVNISAG